MASILSYPTRSRSRQGPSETPGGAPEACSWRGWKAMSIVSTIVWLPPWPRWAVQPLLRARRLDINRNLFGCNCEFSRIYTVIPFSDTRQRFFASWKSRRLEPWDPYVPLIRVLFWVYLVFSFWYYSLVPLCKFHKPIFGNHRKPLQHPPLPSGTTLGT